MTLAVQSSYIHYHYDNYRGPSGMLVAEQVKQAVLNRYINQMMNLTRSRNTGASITDKKQMINLLNEMSSDGAIGQHLINELNSQAFVESWAGQDNFSSGKSLINTGTDIGNITYGPIRIPDEASRIATEVRNVLDNMILAMGNSQQSILVSQLSALRDGQSIPQYKNKINYEGFFPEQQLSLADLDVQKVAQTLQSKMSLLNQMSQGQITGSVEDLASILESVRGCFRNLGGKLAEPVGMHGINVVGYKAEKNILEPADNAFIKSGAKLTRLSARHTGSEKIDGKDIKPDIVMHATVDNIIFEIGGSVKLSQSQNVVLGKESARIKNLHSGFTLGDMLAEGHSLAGAQNLIQWYEAGFGGLKVRKNNKDVNFVSSNSSTGWDNVSTAWEKAKEASKYVGFARMLVGSGKITSKGITDLAGILVVNNNIYSMYAILQQVMNNFNTFVNISGDGWSHSSFIGIHNQIVSTVRKNAENNPEYQDTRVEETKKIIQRFYDKKITMSLKLAGLGFSV